MKYRLDTYRNPYGYRGRNVLVVVIWWFVSAFVFQKTPQFCYGLRRFILRCFGASIGENVKIRSSCRILFPWKLKIGANSWIGDYVDLYNMDEVIIGSNSVVSQYTHVCCGSHDRFSSSFNLVTKPIKIGSSVWIASDCFILPGAFIPDESFYPVRSVIK